MSKALKILFPLFLIDLIVIPFYWQTEMQISSGGLATFATHVFAEGSFASYAFLSYIYPSSTQIIFFLMVVLGVGSLFTAYLAFFYRLYTRITILYLPVMIIVHLTMIPTIYWLFNAIGNLCRWLVRKMRRLYLQEDILQRKLLIDLRMMKRYETENQLKNEINDIKLSQKEIEYQTYLNLIKLKAQEDLENRKGNFEIVSDLLDNEVNHKENRCESRRSRDPVIIKVVSSSPRNSSDLCSICFERRVSHVIVSCGHRICGEAYCHDMLRDRCHICRQPCDKIIRIY